MPYQQHIVLAWLHLAVKASPPLCASEKPVETRNVEFNCLLGATDVTTLGP
jgi:hypothetical protein